MRVYVVEVGEKMTGKYFEYRIEDVFDGEDKAVEFMLEFAKKLIKSECCLFGNSMKVTYLTDELPSFEAVKEKKIIKLSSRSEYDYEIEQFIIVSGFDVK